MPVSPSVRVLHSRHQTLPQALSYTIRVQRFILSLLVLSVVIGAAYYGLHSTSYTYRYRLTIEVEVDGVLRRASSVVELRDYMVSFPEGRALQSATGEALYLDLGPDRRPLIALLTKRRGSAVGLYGLGALMNAYGGTSKWDWDDGTNEGLASLIKNRGAREISASDLPDFVTFVDLEDPKTVIAVDPNNLEGALGLDVKWRRATIEFTDEPTTHGIGQRLTWLSTYHDRMLDEHKPGQQSDDSFASKMNTGSFLRWGF